MLTGDGDADGQVTDPALRPEHPVMLRGGVVLGIVMVGAFAAWVVADTRSAFRLVVYTVLVAFVGADGLRAARVLLGREQPRMVDRRSEASAVVFAVVATALLIVGVTVLG